jgi:hypothetical protein
MRKRSGERPVWGRSIVEGRPTAVLASRLRRTLAITLAGVLLAANLAHAETPSDWRKSSANAAAIGFDAIVLRPLGLAALIASAGAFIPAALLSSPGGRDHFNTAREVFITNPWNALVGPKLGDF